MGNSLHICCAGAPGQEDGADESETIGRQLALLEARDGGARLDAACSAAERLLALLADTGPPGGLVWLGLGLMIGFRDSNGARLDAACSADERLLVLLADAGPPGGLVSKKMPWAVL